MNKLEGKIALITGGSSGIGLATAKGWQFLLGLQQRSMSNYGSQSTWDSSL